MAQTGMGLNRLTQLNLTVETAPVPQGDIGSSVSTGSSGMAQEVALLPRELLIWRRLSGAAHPQLVAAQWALESGWGKTPSGKNNYFGIKAGSGESGYL